MIVTQGLPARGLGMMLCGAGAMALLPGAVLAQDSAGNAAYAGEDADAIIVTATKREQTLQEIPVAVTVTTAETIEREQIRDLRDLQTVVPSLRVTQLQSSANTNFIIRGFGNGANNPGIEPSVGVFVDGVYRSRASAQIGDLPDVSRIEVLRGPQSTLFGKNASAGVISIVTRSPSFTPTGSAELSYGNYDALVARAYVSAPLDERVAVSLAGGINRRDGYNRDEGSGTRTNERDRWFLRGQGLFDNGAGLSVRLIVDYDRIDENCCGVVNLLSSPATAAIRALGGQVSDPDDRFGNVVYNNFPSTNVIDNGGVSAQIDWDTGPVALTSITAFRDTQAEYGQDVDFTSADLLRRFYDQRIDTFTQELRATGTFGPVTALLGLYYFDERVRERQDVVTGDAFRTFADLSIGGTGTGAAVTRLEGTLGTLYGNPAQYLGRFFVPGVSETGTFTLENRALSLFGQFDAELADGLTLTVGGNYTMDDKWATTAYRSSDVFSGIDLVDAGRRAITAQGIATTVGNLLRLGRPATQAEIGGFAQANPAGFAQVQAGAAAFAAANAGNAQVNPLLGARALQLFPPFVNIPNAVESGETDDNDFAYTLRLAYDVTAALNLYASYATGFKASSFNLSRDSRPFAADAAALAGAGLVVNNLTYGSRFAGPEEASVIELGAKADWGRYTANLTGFRQDIDGFQSNIFTGTGFFLANAGKQRTWGVELETAANPVDPLTITLGVTWLDAEYQEFPLASVGDLSGRSVAGVPEWTVVLSGQWAQPLLNGDELVLRSTFHHESETNIVEGLPGFISRGQDAAIAAADQFTREVNELSASVSYLMEGPGVELSLWARNLLDNRYLLSLFDSVAQPFAISGYTNQPRTYGVAARYRF
ncbi:TonB-dependent receptor (plasmid) [Croceibacterium sp. TMG7-5b_MA50]|uniref:TonB-dependent receptor n=1 Tax=Croceibacterium sp. TMG7-5b_MA50 TaxID=3121290 RepID=UPI0032220A74